MTRQILLLLSLILLLYFCFHAPNIIATFLSALALAYLLQPVAKKLSHLLNIPYFAASVIIYLVFMTILVATLSYIIPAIIKQAETLLSKIPEFQDVITGKFLPTFSEKLNKIAGYNVSKQIRVSIESYTASLKDVAGYTVNFIWSSFLSTLNIISMSLLFPILLFFFLKDWNEITNNFKNFMTNIGFDSLNEVWDEADDLIAGFIKALFNVSIILIIYYTTALSFIGFEFPLIIGIISGFAVMVPFIGAVFAIILTMCISLLNYGFDIQQAYILIVFLIGQTLDSSVLTPKIVGDRIGLHPTAIIFSVLVGSQALGIPGLFLAIPTAGIVKIIFMKFILKNNRKKIKNI